MKDNKVSPFRGSSRRRERKERHTQRVETERRIFERRHEGENSENVLSFWVKDDNAELDYFIVEFNLKDKITLGEFKARLHKDLGDLIEENKIE